MFNSKQLLFVPRVSADYRARVNAVATHDEMLGVRIGNWIGDRLRLPNNCRYGDNLVGRIVGALASYVGASHGFLSAVVNPSYGKRLVAKWGGEGRGEHEFGTRR
jgi:hypothetical protein